MRKSIFVNKISEIRYNGLKESNIKSGFEATGIFSFNSAKNPEKRSTSHNTWVANGKSESDMIALATSVETPRKELQTETPKLYNLPPKPITFNANQQTTSTQIPVFNVIGRHLFQDLYLRVLCGNVGGNLCQRI